MSAQYAIGIDLGTTNSVLAYSALSDEQGQPDVQILPIPQLTASATVEAQSVLPSFMYQATDEDASSGHTDLPWSQGNPSAVGAWARNQSSEVPMRTIAAAKSWLCHSRIDRREAILPWNAPEDIQKISPVAVSAAYLQHLASAWNAAHPEALLADQHVVLTVPASFDASARELTREAAQQAGLPEECILLEEPQAAIYAWLDQQGEDWRKALNKGDALLVCDVGGGTSDFTLVRAEEEEGELVLRRIAVGNHILVGGDNMDLLMAHIAQAGFAEKGVEVDAWQSVALWHACRKAKESLLTDGGVETHPVSVLGRGRSVIGSAIQIELNRNDMTNALLDGFFPNCEREAKPQRGRSAGFKELGLPFEQDTAITRHLAGFLQAQEEDGQAIVPTHVLFNGGTFKAQPFRERLLSLLGDWFDGQAPGVLHGYDDLDFAVARGAAYYAATQAGGGIRIRGGTARSYYLGIETSGLAIPGAPRPMNAFCVVPMGMEEGTSCEVPGEDFGLVTGEPAHFRIFTSSTRKDDHPGDLLSRWNDDELQETDSMETELPASEEADEGFVPVRFESRITELGMFELWCSSALSDHRWKFEFSARDES